MVGNNWDSIQIKDQLCSSLECVQQENGKEIRLDNLFTTSMLLDSLKIKTILYPSLTRITLYYNLYRPYEGGEWRCIQAIRSPFVHITL